MRSQDQSTAKAITTKVWRRFRFTLKTAAILYPITAIIVCLFFPTGPNPAFALVFMLIPIPVLGPVLGILRQTSAFLWEIQFSILLAIALLPLVFAHIIRPNTVSAVLTTIALAFWFLIGLYEFLYLLFAYA